MKATAYGALCAALALAATEIPSQAAGLAVDLFAAVAFGAFIANVGRRPVRTQEQA
jgi:hypothetical protein